MPEDAPLSCPGTTSSVAGKSASCSGCPNQSACSSGQAAGIDLDKQAAKIRLSGVRYKLLVLSGKGGVGKSTLATQLAMALSANGDLTGLLDIDICGPSIPRMVGAENEEVRQAASGWQPVWVDDSLCVISIGYMIPTRNNAVIWRGVRKNGLIKQFLKDS